MERLRRLRKQRGLTQDELAKAIKISKSSINMYERGEREPSHETLIRIADFFGVSTDYLIGRARAKAERFEPALFICLSLARLVYFHEADYVPAAKAIYDSFEEYRRKHPRTQEENTNG